LRLNYGAVCVVCEIESKGKTIHEAIGSLKKTITHHTDLAIKNFTKEKAYAVLMEKKEFKLLLMYMVCKSYRQAELHEYNYTYKEIKYRERLMLVLYYLDLLNRLFFCSFYKNLCVKNRRTISDIYYNFNSAK
jgi:translation initiation factor 2 beta subunit (eIF-2beta)/eIF-5